MSAKKVLMGQYEMHNTLYNTVTADISDDESNKSVADPMNSVKWLAGHMLWAQGNLAKLGDVIIDNPWNGHFASGPGATAEELAMPKGEMPTLEAIRNKWNEVTPAIREGLQNMPDEVLNSVVEFKHPIQPYDNTLAGLWSFLNHHQAYTIGQMGILRRGLGKEAMKYFLS